MRELQQERAAEPYRRKLLLLGPTTTSYPTKHLSLAIFAKSLSRRQGSGCTSWALKWSARRRGTYVDGQEREDVVEYRQTFLRRMTSRGFLNVSNAPTEEANSFLISRPPHPMSLQKQSSFFMTSRLFKPTTTNRLYGPPRGQLSCAQVKREWHHGV